MPHLADIVLKLDGIDGESVVKGHRKEIDVLSYEQGIDLTVIHGAGGGSAAGKASLAPVRFRKNVDAASIPMLLACAAGKHIAAARFTFRRGAGGFEFYKVTLEEVLITHIAQRAGTGAQYPLSFGALDTGAASDGFLDEVTLDYRRIRWEYKKQSPAGGAAGTVTGGWDVLANTRL
jgi:type VI secretion system secreted protein Hcp